MIVSSLQIDQFDPSKLATVGRGRSHSTMADSFGTTIIELWHDCSNVPLITTYAILSLVMAIIFQMVFYKKLVRKYKTTFLFNIFYGLSFMLSNCYGTKTIVNNGCLFLIFIRAKTPNVMRSETLTAFMIGSMGASIANYGLMAFYKLALFKPGIIKNLKGFTLVAFHLIPWMVGCVWGYFSFITFSENVEFQKHRSKGDWTNCNSIVHIFLDDISIPTNQTFDLEIISFANLGVSKWCQKYDKRFDNFQSPPLLLVIYGTLMVSFTCVIVFTLEVAQKVVRRSTLDYQTVMTSRVLIAQMKALIFLRLFLPMIAVLAPLMAFLLTHFDGVDMSFDKYGLAQMMDVYMNFEPVCSIIFFNLWVKYTMGNVGAARRICPHSVVRLNGEEERTDTEDETY